MDTVWVDTMFPGIDPDEGWEKNLERVVNYDYLLKEYLDWQLKHLTTDNFDQVDWSNVTADLIHLSAEYTDKEVEAAATLSLETAKEYARAQLAAQYAVISEDIQTAATATLEAADDHADIKLESYYTKTEIGDFTGYQTAMAAMQAMATAAAASIDLTAAYTYTDNKIGNIGNYASIQAYADALISGLSLTAKGSGSTARLALMSGQTELGSGASMALSVTNNSNGYSYVKLTSGGIDLATSGNITLGGNVVFASGSGSTKNLSYTTISGGTVTTNTITALNITANDIVANASISSPTITGGSISGANFYSSDRDSYLVMNANGWSMYQKTGGTMYRRAYLAADAQDKVTLIMGNSSPKLKLEKYFSGGHYLFLGNDDGTHGLTINLDTGAYSFS